MFAGHITISTTPAPVTTQTSCRKVRLREDASAGTFPTANFTLQIPNSSAAAVQYPAGVEREISAPGGFFYPGAVVCYIAAAAGTMTFIQEEE